MEQYASLFEENKSLWNKRTESHKNSDFYDIEGFKKGKLSLNPLELEMLGDVKNKSLLHLQCHFGLDTLSWSRLGAKATGVDFSGESIKLAQQLNEETGLDAKFVCSNIYDLKKNLDGKFDIVFASYGVTNWLPDLDAWADIIAHFLKDGGIFFIADTHPVVFMFDNDLEQVTYSYFNEGPIMEEQQGTYADRDASIKQKEYSWNHSLTEIVSALIKAGLNIRSLGEYPYTFYNCFAGMGQNAQGFWEFKKYGEKMPVTYSIKAVKG